jgi:hypothetical protein
MTAPREPVVPTSDMPLSVAAEELTGFETLAIEKRFGRKMEELSAASLTMAIVWACENRTAKTAWNVVEAMTLRQLGGYFQDEPPDVDAEDPDSDLGKESSPDAPTTGG